VNLLDFLYSRGIQLRKAGSTAGGEWQGPCPWCGGDDRFHVWPEKNTTDKQGREVKVPGAYWCRPGLGHCGRSGDAIQFVIDYDHVTFKEAISKLGINSDYAGWCRYPKERRPESGSAPWQPAERPDPAGTWKGEAQKFVMWAADRIFESPDTLLYLARRGIREETVAEFWLGWNPGTPSKKPGGKTWGLFRKREEWGLLPEKDEKTGKAKSLWLPVGWVIPYIVGGDVVRIRIRQPDDFEFGPRYDFVEGGSATTMVIEPAPPTDHDVYVVVESELDAVLIAQEARDLCGVVALGSASTRPDKAAAVKLGRAAWILNALDADGAGAKESGKWWREHYPEAVRWPVPEGKDPGDAWKAGVNIREWITEGLPEGLRRGHR
jgi:hypothetical protein